MHAMNMAQAAFLLLVHQQARSRLLLMGSRLQVVDMIASKKPKQFVRAVRPTLVVQALCNMIMEPGILDAEEDDMPASRIAGQVSPSLAPMLHLVIRTIMPAAAMSEAKQKSPLWL